MTLIVPFDGSALSKAALVRAAQFDTILNEGVVVVTVIPNENTKYARDRGWIDGGEPFDAEAVLAHLREAIADIQSGIDEWKTEFEVESRDELESTLTDGGLDSTAIRERNRVLRQWERYEDNKRLLKHALELYDDARELYPGQNGPSNSSIPLSQ